MKKLFLSNIIENDTSLQKLSRESLLKIINTIPSYLEKDIIKLIDEIIEKYKDETLIEISNIKINDIKSEIFKTKYKLVKDLIDFKIYEYENYVDLYFTGKEINCEKLIEKIKKHVTQKNFKVIHITSRTIKTAHVIKLENYTEEEINIFIYEKIKK